MSVPRWPLCVLIFTATFVSTSPGSAAPAPTDEPPVEWVRTGSDAVVEVESFDAMQDALSAEQSTSSGPFQPVEVGQGFNIFGLRNYGDYTIKLVTGGDIELYRDEVQALVNEVNLANGLSLQLAVPQVPAPAFPNQLSAGVGEIRIMIATTSPCGSLVPPSNTLGCGGVYGSTVIDGVPHWTGGVVWLRPPASMSSALHQVVVSHEIGHGLGLDHFNDSFEGNFQVMKGFVTNEPYTGLKSGDLNGVHWLSDTPPSNDNMAGAALVCPGDSSVSASTWFATKEPTELAHAGAGPRRSVWYQYVPRPEQDTGTATITTSNDGIDDFDTVLDVYSGATPTDFVASNDNFTLPGTLSQVSFPINSAKTYWIAVDGAGFGRGETDVVFDLPPVTADFLPLCAPIRILDTRPGGQTVDGLHKGGGQIPDNVTYELPVAGRAGIPPDAESVVLNVTAVAPNGWGFVTVFPCGQAVPNASNLNFVAGDVIPNSVLAKVGVDGKVCLFTSAKTHLLVDLSGYFPADDVLVPLAAPGRLLDTRVGGQTFDGEHQAVGAIAANDTYELPVLDRAGVLDTAETVVLNVTAVQPLAGGFLTVFPCGQGVPNASNLNFVSGDIIPNLVLARVGVDGKVCIFTSATTHLLVDVSGNFPGVTDLVPLTVPNRVLDTRPTGTTIDGLHQAVGRIAANTTYELQINGRAGVPANAMSVVLNVTAVVPSSAGFLTVYACGQNLPNASNLNFTAGEVIANSVKTRAGTGGKVCLYSSAETHLLVDVSAYFP